MVLDLPSWSHLPSWSLRLMNDIIVAVRMIESVKFRNNNNNVHLSCVHQRPERSHDIY